MRQLCSSTSGGTKGVTALARHICICEAATRERARRLGPVVRKIPAVDEPPSSRPFTTRSTGPDSEPRAVKLARIRHQMAVTTNGGIGVMYPMHPGQPARAGASRGPTNLPAEIVADSISNVISRWALSDTGWTYTSDSDSAALVRLGYQTFYLRRGKIPELWYLDVTFSPRRRPDGALQIMTKARAIDHTQRQRVGSRVVSFAVADVPSCKAEIFDDVKVGDTALRQILALECKYKNLRTSLRVCSILNLRACSISAAFIVA
jgi:hypothetical protein